MNEYDEGEELEEAESTMQYNHENWIYRCPDCFLERGSLYQLQSTRCKR